MDSETATTSGLARGYGFPTGEDQRHILGLVLLLIVAHPGATTLVMGDMDITVRVLT
jgi:hypothetical protein